MGENWLREIGKSPGLRVWRIDNKSLELSNVPKTSHGVFKEEDSYIALDARIGDKFVFDVFLWFGKWTTIKDYAKGKAADLEKHLGAVNSRSEEFQEKESSAFKALFKCSLRYVEPLVLSEQINVRDEEYPTRLYHLKGKKTVRVDLVALSYKSLNGGDVFLLDADTKIFQWNGRGSSRMEKAKALDLTVRLRDERMNRCKAIVIIIDEGKETDEFWSLIGGKGPIADAKSGGSDEEWEERALKEHKLYKISEEGDQFKLNLVDTKNQHLHSSHLEPENVYLVDAVTQIFIWMGRYSSQKIKSNVREIAKKFVTDNKRPVWTACTYVTQSVEPALFRAQFRGPFNEYIDTPEAHEARLKKINSTAGTLREEVINVDALHHPEKYRAAREELTVFVPDAQLESVQEKEIKIWLIKEKEKHPLPEEEYGIFYSGQSYVMLYSIRLTYGRRHVVYFWQGRNSSVDDKGSASLLATELSQTKGRGCTLIRVVQGKEPDHFLTHFAGYMCTRKGKRENWEKENENQSKLYHVRGTNGFDTTAQQIEAKAFSLNSNDVFVLDAPDCVYVWHGRGANSFELKTGESVVNRIVDKGQNKKRQTVPEGSEPESFWKALGGKAEYNNSPQLIIGNISAKLFHCTDKTGVFKVDEIADFTQDDLDPEDVFLLDAFDSLFVWIGVGSTENERQKGSSLAVEYIKAADDGRLETCPIYVVDAGSEPLSFIVHFHGWDETKAKDREDIYSRKLRELQLTDAVVGGFEAVTYGRLTRAPTDTPVKAPINLSSLNPKNIIFPFDRLKVKPLPAGVDGGCLEAFISDEEFALFFKQTRAEFYKLPKWKQLRVKKEIGLF